jgi:hypothetical protein
MAAGCRHLGAIGQPLGAMCSHLATGCHREPCASNLLLLAATCSPCSHLQPLELQLAVALVYDGAAQDERTRCWKVYIEEEQNARLCLIDLRAVIDTLCVLPSVPGRALARARQRDERPLMFLCPP